MTLFPAIHPSLRSIFGLFVLTIFLSVLRVIWLFDQAPELSVSSKIIILGLACLFNGLFYGGIAYCIYRKSSRVRYGYSTLTLASFAYYCVIAFVYYLRTGSLEHTDFNNLITLAPQILGALLLFNPELDGYFTSQQAAEGPADISPADIKNLI